MKLVKKNEREVNHFPAPYERTIEHIITPWTCGSKYVWLAQCTYPAGTTSNPHTHETQEECFFVIQGSGQIKVNDTYLDVTVGDTVYVEPGELHCVINPKGHEDLILMSVVTPPFSEDSFKKDHTPKS